MKLALCFILLFGIISNSVQANWLLEFAEGIKEGIQETFEKSDEKFTTGKDAKSKAAKEKLHKVLGDLGKKVADWHKDFAEKHGIKEEVMKDNAHKIWKKIKHHVFHKMFKKENDTKSGHPRIHRVEEHKALQWGNEQLMKAEDVYKQLANEWAENLKKKAAATTGEEPVEQVDGPTPPGPEESSIKEIKDSLKEKKLSIKDVSKKVSEMTFIKPATKLAEKETDEYFPVEVVKKEIKGRNKYPEKKVADFTNVMKIIEEKEHKFSAMEKDWEKDLKQKEDDAKKEFKFVDEKKSVLPEFVKIKSIPSHHIQTKAEKFQMTFTKPTDQDLYNNKDPFFSFEDVKSIKKAIEEDNKSPKKKGVDFTKAMKKTAEKELIFNAMENEWEKDLQKKADVKKVLKTDEESELPEFVKVESVPGHHNRMGMSNSGFYFVEPEKQTEENNKKQSTKSKNAKKDLKDIVLVLPANKDSKAEINNDEPEVYFHFDGDAQEKIPTTVDDPAEVLFPNKEAEELPETEEKKLIKEPQKGHEYWLTDEDKEFQRKLLEEESAWSKMHSTLMTKLKKAEERIDAMKSKKSNKYIKKFPFGMRMGRGMIFP